MKRIALALALFAPGAQAQAVQLHPLSALWRFPAPPAGFVALLASNADLARYGLPARPDPRAMNGTAYAAWARAMRALRTYIVPELQVLPIQHLPAQHVTHANATSANWAGQTLSSSATAYGGASFSESLAQWVVSGAQQAVGTCSGTDYSATWVGVDGFYTTTDVMQAGTEADATCSGGRTTQNLYAWVEWYPSNSYELYNFPIVDGGSVFVVAQATSATQATASFVNLQTGAYTSFGFAAPAGTHLVGSSAEWVVERPQVNKVNATLADFGEIPMESELVYTVAGLAAGSPSGPGIPAAGQTESNLTMANIYGTSIAGTVPQGGTAQLVQVDGPTE